VGGAAHSECAQEGLLEFSCDFPPQLVNQVEQRHNRHHQGEDGDSQVGNVDLHQPRARAIHSAHALGQAPGRCGGTPEQKEEEEEEERGRREAWPLHQGEQCGGTEGVGQSTVSRSRWPKSGNFAFLERGLKNVNRTEQAFEREHRTGGHLIRTSRSAVCKKQ